jgi:hypothetical protein
MSVIRVRGMRVLPLLSIALMAMHVVLAQPPVGPDPQPKTISTEEFNKMIGGPSLVTMDFKDARPEKVYAALAEQAGMVLDEYLFTDLLKTLPPMTVSIKGQPILVALGKLAAQQGLHFTFRHHARSPACSVALQLRKINDPQMEMDGPMLERERRVSIALRHSQMEFTEFYSLRVC